MDSVTQLALGAAVGEGILGHRVGRRALGWAWRQRWRRAGAVDGNVVMTDLRMGVHPFYVFRFKVAELGNPHPQATPSEQLNPTWEADDLKALLRRIWSPEAWPPASTVAPDPGRYDRAAGEGR